MNAPWHGPLTDQTVVLPFEPRSPVFRANPYPTYRYLQTHQPMYYRAAQNDWILTRYVDIVSLLQHPHIGHAEGGLPELPLPPPDASLLHRLWARWLDSQTLMNLWVILRNPPDHARLRQVIQPCFTAHRMQALRAEIQARVDDQIDRLQAQGRMDLVHDLAYPLTTHFICQIMGMEPPDQQLQFRQWAQELAGLVDLDVSPLARERGLRAIASLATYFRGRMALSRSVCQDPDPLIHRLMAAQAECLANCILMFFAGHATT